MCFIKVMHAPCQCHLETIEFFWHKCNKNLTFEPFHTRLGRDFNTHARISQPPLKRRQRRRECIHQPFISISVLLCGLVCGSCECVCSSLLSVSFVFACFLVLHLSSFLSRWLELHRSPVALPAALWCGSLSNCCRTRSHCRCLVYSTV